MYFILGGIVLLIMAWHSFFAPDSWNDLVRSAKSVKHGVQGGTLEVFQVYKPVPEPSKGGESSDCAHEILLMDHVFGWSYGKPFVGKIASCPLKLIDLIV